MEKFGIFELLDALSALAAPQKSEPSSPSAEDGAFAPPAYGGQTEERQAEPPAKKDAFASFVARHDAASRRIDRKK